MNNKKSVEVSTQSAVFCVPSASTTTEGSSNSELSRNEAFMTKEYAPIPKPASEIKLKFSTDHDPIEEAHNAFNMSSLDSEYESTSETLLWYTPYYPKSEPITVGISKFQNVKFVKGQTEMGSSSNLFQVKEKEKDIDYRVSFRRPSIDPPFVVESSSVATANDVAQNTVSNFDIDAEENTEQNIPTDDDTKDVHTETTEPLVERRIKKVHPLENVKVLIKGDSPNPISKKLPSKPTNSIKRKRSDTYISSSPDEDIPPKPTSKGDDLTETSVANIQQAQSVSMKVSMENNKLLKQILLTLAALTPFTITSTLAKTLKRKIEDLDKPEKVYNAAETNPTHPILTSVAAESSSVATEDILREKAKGKTPIIEKVEEEKAIPTKTSEYPHRIIPGTNMPLLLARRLQEQEDEAKRKESAERKIEVYQSRMAAKRKLQKKISQKESDKAQRKTWQNELVACGKFKMKDLIGTKMSTLSEMVKQVRKEQVIAQQNISSTISQPSQPTEILKVKIKTVEELKASSLHQSPTRVELSTPSPQ
ncbi:hypothetical protein L1987_48602 [Smallanthus sonchifolius]|uniref:Uncharacterized protein n=1 Tax=Smallanthus sonchifolius TaxID=185202 RepID=A0ACB9FS42_9ASTR|nr:hypothetical protein L1987_48602 [Smallanthus sonchifolius]